MISSRRPPTFIPEIPWTQPGITPCDVGLVGASAVVNVWWRFHEASKTFPVLHTFPT